MKVICWGGELSLLIVHSRARDSQFSCSITPTSNQLETIWGRNSSKNLVSQFRKFKLKPSTSIISIEPDARMLPRETVLYGVGKIFHLEIFTETVSENHSLSIPN